MKKEIRAYQNGTIVAIQHFLKKRGFKIGKYPEPDRLRRLKALNHFGITKVFDIGANTGTYGIELRSLGYKGDIFSFEPTQLAYSLLEKKCSKDTKWNCFKIGLGNKDEELEINISLNSKSSSILDMLPIHILNAPDSKYINKEIIKIKTLNELLPSLCTKEDRILLKIDTQGYEKNVLLGGDAVLNRISLIQVELSFKPLYKGESDFWQMNEYIQSLGFQLFSLETDESFSNPKSGELLQVDCIFVKQ